MNENDKVIDKLKDLIKEKNLKYTKQRELILKTVLEVNEHLNAEEVYNVLKKNYPELKIGIATVYRALSFLEELNLLSSISIGNDGKKFESNNKKHHDHLVCIKCGKIVEFFSEDIEKKQDKIAKENGFDLVDHTMYLYGICKDCKS